MQAQIETIVQEALAGSRKVKVTFHKDATPDAMYLVGMAQGGIVQISEMDKATLMCVTQSGNWEHDRNRVVVVTLTDTFHMEWFESRMCRALENIEVAA